MDNRLQLVEAWKAKLALSVQPPSDRGERFSWVRQIYTRIYRFLVSCYGEGEWRAAGNDSIASGDLSSASHMPFVDDCPTTGGLAPKSPERIRSALVSIHSSNPGIATAGTMRGVDDETWVVVAASRKSNDARAVHRCLVACRIEAGLKDRTTDTAVIVRHQDFQRALAVVKRAGRTKQVQGRMRATVDPTAAVGGLLFILSFVVLFGGMLLSDVMRPSVHLAFGALWMAGLASGWLYARGRRTL